MNGEAGPGGIDGRVFPAATVPMTVLTIEPTEADDITARMWASVRGAEQRGLDLAPDVLRDLADDLWSRANLLDPRPDAPLQIVRGGPGRGCPRVEGRCPACGVRGLFLGAGARVTCASLSCPDPSAVDTYLDPTGARPAARVGQCMDRADGLTDAPLVCELTAGHDGAHQQGGASWRHMVEQVQR